jgi:ketosteroid isomerase-like protein
MKLSRQELIKALQDWNQAWDNHDLEGVLALFGDDILFENWTGAKVKGKEALRKAWATWFTNHGGFRFSEEDTFIDEEEQKILYRWLFESPSFEKGFEGKPERRRGVDLLYFKDGKIVEKRTYSKTTIEIDGERIPLTP